MLQGLLSVDAHTDEYIPEHREHREEYQAQSPVLSTLGATPQRRGVLPAVGRPVRLGQPTGASVHQLVRLEEVEEAGVEGGGLVVRTDE